MKIMRRKHHLW